MRFGVLADIHANAHALDAALAFLEREGVDAYLCAGDLVGYGPLPGPCIDRVLGLPGRVVTGNHELMLLGELAWEGSAPSARRSLRWTRDALDPAARDRLAALPRSVSLDGIVVTHGSLADPEEYVDTTERARRALAELEAREPEASVLVVGHTHRPMAVAQRGGRLLHGETGEVALPRGDRVLLNPGAVGQSRSGRPRARVMVLDLEARTARFHTLRYDVRGCRRALRAHGLPVGSYHTRSRALPQPSMLRAMLSLRAGAG
jgi:predicted phosphodiesterase